MQQGSLSLSLYFSFKKLGSCRVTEIRKVYYNKLLRVILIRCQLAVWQTQNKLSHLDLLGWQGSREGKSKTSTCKCSLEKTVLLSEVKSSIGLHEADPDTED